MVFSFWQILSICFIPLFFSSGRQPVLPSYPFCVVWYLIHAFRLASVHPSVFLFISIYIYVSHAIYVSVLPYVPLRVLFSLLLNFFNPASTPPHLCQCLIRFTPSFPFFHFLLPSCHVLPFTTTMCHVLLILTHILVKVTFWISGFYIFPTKITKTEKARQIQNTGKLFLWIEKEELSAHFCPAEVSSNTPGLQL